MSKYTSYAQFGSFFNELWPFESSLPKAIFQLLTDRQHIYRLFLVHILWSIVFGPYSFYIDPEWTFEVFLNIYIFYRCQKLAPHMCDSDHFMRKV